MVDVKVVYEKHDHEYTDTIVTEQSFENWLELGKWCQELESSGFSVWYKILKVEVQ